MPSKLDNVIAVILVGGYGTRIKHLLNGIPKPMAVVAGKPFVEWVIRYLKIQGIQKILLSTGYLAEVVEQYCQNQPVEGVQISCHQETIPLGTAGGFLNTVHQSGETPEAWLVLNGDSLVFADLALLIDHFSHPTINAAILGLSVTDAARYGSLVYNQLGYLEKFMEKQPGNGVINTGVYLLRHSLIPEFPQSLPLSFENEVFPYLLKKNIPIKVDITHQPFLDIGTPESLSQAELFILENTYQFVK
jgi:D-glycero-alpha-D-manno-heptose 1-phosphate guanylyltransferase